MVLRNIWTVKLCETSYEVLTLSLKGVKAYAGFPAFLSLSQYFFGLTLRDCIFFDVIISFYGF
jgi:hypothetical protein